MNHYFDDNQHLKSNRKEISFRFWCFDYSFLSDNGVFSKDEIDEGSKVLLNAIKDADLGAKILDLGCGYGTIGIILKKTYVDKDVWMVDVNSRALQLAEENALRNDVKATIIKSNIFDSINDECFDSIITNPPIRAGKQVIYKMFKESYEHLHSKGCLYVVIRKSHGAKSAQKYIDEVFGNCEIIKKDQGYYILCAKKN
ncbi:16S rRNA (guanine1207-N2)-methyltransferase [Breznakia sp. PF5-3]|uniref:class I SAM-dependent methyltransferase n=1 Tax=unclassified Breznakia TaxID=2623764 RepID=UPI002404C8B0|nr:MULTISPECIES: class I SAM-dependent methyltransferase [unclassified Breznakia]MDF9825554.1 16S rRNA (guanine1207-N2)-methyltransferase [Breznakia sp. PM6-1]MDF9836402.1 16S rRNA (guanine1207-N2)-methyltransferase [Breznakia sp. PF5-3]MDF9838207.1 16S rRNA (guanine1207-N2)-methyltransferase [Breznakia sp. PFB2-8]MDF9860200.1 16S rRNA (guanine1207-N2)-methyltransferase [Breznakia sp. PH5-24]